MTPSRLKRWTGRGLILLVGLIPLHAIIVISLGHFVGHQDIWASWKEVLLILLTASTTWLVIIDSDSRQRLRRPAVYAIGAFAVVALAATLTNLGVHPGSIGTTNLVLGARDDLEFLVAAVIAIVVADTLLVKRLVYVLLGSTAIVVTFGLLQLTVLPHNFLSHLGYVAGPGQTAPFETVLVGNVTHYRFGSTLGGPNQLGTFLILPLALTVAMGFRRYRWWLASAAMLPVLFGTYSRGAWIGAIIAIAIVKIVSLQGRIRLVAMAAVAVLIVIVGGLAAMPSSNNLVARYFHHGSLTAASSSDSQHVSSLTNGLSNDVHAWYGRGLGTAGPATFHGATIHIIENNYLQIGYETGLLGMALFIAIVGLFVLGLHQGNDRPIGLAASAAIIGVSITALVLPAWTDTATALTVWTVAGAALGAKHV